MFAWRRTARRLSLVVAIPVLIVALGGGAGRAADEPPATKSDRSQAEVASGAAALAAAQELEAKVIQLRRELDSLQKQRGSADDLRRRIDELEARVAGLRRELAALPPPPSPSSFEAPPPDVLSTDRASYGTSDRFSDGPWQARPTLRLQGGFEGVAPDRVPGQPAPADAAGFTLRHLEVMFEGRLPWQRFEYRLQLDFASAPAGSPAPPASLTLLRDAYVQWRFLPALALRLGRFPTPFSLQAQYWTGLYELVDQSAATAEFNLDRDVGLMLVARPWDGRLQVQLAATNGTPTTFFNDNLDLAYSARIVAAPLGALPLWEGDLSGSPRPLFSVGASGTFNLQTGIPARDRDSNGRPDNVETWQAAAEVRAVWRGAALQAEYFRRWEYPGAAGPDRQFWGGYVQAGYFVLSRRLQLAARLGRADRPLFGAAEDVRQPLGRAITERSGALTYYLRGHDLKIQVDYSHLRVDDAVAPAPTSAGAIAYSPHSHRVRGAVQVTF